MCEVLPGLMLQPGLRVWGPGASMSRGDIPAARGDIPAARGASAEFAAALQVPEVIESKCGSKALPLPMRRAGGRAFYFSSVPWLL